MLRVLECFAGLGACSKALERLGIEHEIVDAVEIDKYAIQSFNAIHGTNFEPQDITKWDKDIQVDLIMHGSPCQDFSVAGKGAGGDKDSGTRSSLMYETLRIVEKLKPKYVIWENVKNLLSKKHKHNFDAYIEAMNELGYVSKYQVLNAKDYGVPQNRERVFTVSILGGGDFEFPEKQELTVRLKDVLEAEVDEKFYLSEEQVASFEASTAKAQAKGNRFKFEPIERERERDCGSHDSNESRESADRQLHQGVVGRVAAINGHDILKRVYGVDGCSPTLPTMQGGSQEPKIIASRGRGMNNKQQLEARKDGLTNTITSVAKDNYVAEPGGVIVEDFYKSREPKIVARTDTHQKGGVYSSESVSPTITATTYKQPTQIAEPRTTRGRVIASTIRASIHKQGARNLIENVNNGRGYEGVVEPRNQDCRIRKLTPKECWRLMGFDDEDFEKAAKVNSNTQLYKQAGNSIVVNVLEGILRNLIKKGGTN
jgi:DNA (cytosine-5)-methyltransferase 1